MKIILSSKISKAKRMLVDTECSLPDIFKKHLDKTNGKYIVFCSNKEHLNKAMQECETWFSKIENVEVNKYKVSSDYSGSKREFNEFSKDFSEDKIKLLFSIDMISEGIHLKDIDGVIMLRVTESMNVYYQQLGRALSASKGTKRPKIFDLVNNFENSNPGAINEGLVYQLCDKMTEIGSEIEFEIYDYIIDLKEILDEINNTFESSWDYTFDYLKEFLSEYKRFPLSKENYQNIKIGSWCITQRVQYSNGILRQDRIEALNSLGFVWSIQDEAWDINYYALCEFINKHNHLPKSTENRTLNTWISKQKRLNNAGKLELRKCELLEKIG